MVTTPLSGQVIKASDANLLQFWTPTWTGITPGSGAINEAWYQQVGNMIFWGMRLEMGTSPSLPTPSTLMSMPPSALPYPGGGTGLAIVLGTWSMRYSGTSNFSGAVVCNDSAGANAKFAGAWTGAVPNGNIGQASNVPASGLAATNVLSAAGCYRAQ